MTNLVKKLKMASLKISKHLGGKEVIDLTDSAINKGKETKREKTFSVKGKDDFVVYYSKIDYTRDLNHYRKVLDNEGMDGFFRCDYNVENLTYLEFMEEIKNDKIRFNTLTQDNGSFQNEYADVIIIEDSENKFNDRSIFRELITIVSFAGQGGDDKASNAVSKDMIVMIISAKLREFFNRRLEDTPTIEKLLDFLCLSYFMEFLFAKYEVDKFDSSEYDNIEEYSYIHAEIFGVYYASNCAMFSLDESADLLFTVYNAFNNPIDCFKWHYLTRIRHDEDFCPHPFYKALTKR